MYISVFFASVPEIKIKKENLSFCAKLNVELKMQKKGYAPESGSESIFSAEPDQRKIFGSSSLDLKSNANLKFLFVNSFSPT